jgi:hypothetical protein
MRNTATSLLSSLLPGTLAALITLAGVSPSRADVPVRVDVTYSVCCIVEGPLSLGLDELPEEVYSTFVFLSPSWPPPLDTLLEPEVLFASFGLGDMHGTAENLEYFRIAFSIPEEQPLTISDLTYLGVVDETETAKGADEPNSSFQVDITGTDKASDEFFHYHCDQSAQTFAPITSISAFLDVKPGSCPNAFQPESHGVLPVALLSGGAFAPTDVDLVSLRLVRADGIGGSVAPLDSPRPVVADVATPFLGDACDCHTSTGDGDADLSLKFDSGTVSSELALSGMPADEAVELVLRGFLVDGTLFEAGDCIRIVSKGPRTQAPGGGLQAISRLRSNSDPGSVGRTIAFDLKSSGWTDVEVFDVAGRRVGAPYRGQLPGGSHEIVWNGHGSGGRELAQGVYFVRVRSGGEERTLKLVHLLRR